MAGLGTRLLKVSVGGTDYTAEVSRAVITSSEADSDFVTFADAAAGGKREYRLEFTGVQDAETGSLWDQIWSNAGASVACVLMPYGNATATTDQPHFSFNATITEPDGDFIGGEANSSTSARFTFEASWVLDAKPTKVTV